MEYDKNARCSCLPDDYYFVLGGRSVQTLVKWSILSIFCRLGQIFGQVKAWITLNFADIVNFVSFNLALSCFLSMILGSEHSALVY